MPKNFYKYLTKPTDEAIDFILSFKKADKETLFKEIKDFLNDRSNTILLQYEFKKLVGVAFFNVEENSMKASCEALYLENSKQIQGFIYTIGCKLINFRLSFFVSKLDKKYIPEIKKYATEVNEDNTVYSVILGG